MRVLASALPDSVDNAIALCGFVPPSFARFGGLDSTNPTGYALVSDANEMACW
jgi:hypothetical protein